MDAIDPAHLRRLRRAIRALHAWFRGSARDLPWRRTRDPYAIWVSEVMLQQTQVATVQPYFAAWLAAFPTVGHLARGDEEQVLRLWEGLGYYSRARNLHRAARQVVERFDGIVPDDPEQLASLPGIGPYTVAAVASIAFDRDLAVVDGNVRRVLGRLLALEQDPSRPPASRRIERLARALLPSGAAALHNQAMMELGALVCTPRAPRCAGCPLARPCLARATGSPERFPGKRARRPVPHQELAVALVLRRGRVLIDRRPSEGLLGGLWELPRVPLEPDATPERLVARGLAAQLGLSVRVERPLPPVQHAYTHFTVTLHPFLCRLARVGNRAGKERRAVRWVRPAELGGHPMSAADRKVIERLHAALRQRRRP
jgi:A/G-specific adenine glycosylase